MEPCVAVVKLSDGAKEQPKEGGRFHRVRWLLHNGTPATEAVRRGGGRIGAARPVGVGRPGRVEVNPAVAEEPGPQRLDQ